MAQTSDVAGQCRISWSVFEDNSTLQKQRESTAKSGALYSPPGPYDLNGYAGDATLIKKTSNQGDKLRVIATTNGLGAAQRSLFPNDDAMAVEALKLEYRLGPILAADLNISNERETTTGVKGLFFGTVKIVADERLVPGDKVMVDFSDPSKAAKVYGNARPGTARNTRRPLIFVKYTPSVSSTRLMTHIRSVLSNPKLYSQIAQSNKKSAQAWANAVRFIFADDMLKITLALQVMRKNNLITVAPGATELFAEDGSSLNDDEFTVRLAQWLHATPMDRKRRDIRDNSLNGARGWEQTRLDILQTIYFDGVNRRYEFGFNAGSGASPPTSNARDLKTGKVKNTAEGDVLRMQINSPIRRATATFMADDDTKQWVVGVMMVGARQGKNGVLLITQTSL